MIAFTGSTTVGRKIGAVAGATLKRASLELGGKNPFIVLPGADVEAAVCAGAFGAFFNQGQVCVGAGIHFVHATLVDQYAARVAELAKAIKVGDPFLEQVGLGPLISEKQRNRVHAIVQEAIHEEAELLEGGSFTGKFYRPTVLTKVSQASRAFKEEIFGPVAVIVSFKDESEAIRLANKNEYGLAASVFGEEEHARKVGRQIETGILHINDTTVMNDVNARFGGIKASGNLSRFGGHSDVEEYTTWKWITETYRPVNYEIS
jgi:benzaldehyde dehydrogenase (NAD)